MKNILPLLALTLLSGCSYLGISDSSEQTAMTPPPEPTVAAMPAPSAPPQPTLAVADAWVAVTPKGAKVAAGFMTVDNPSAAEDHIVAAKSARAGRVELHETKMVGKKATMRPLKDGIKVPPGGSIALNQTGMHLMFMEIKGPFAEGETVPVTLTFEKGGDIEVAMTVKAQGPTGAQH